jgi:hypothetical protein
VIFFVIFWIRQADKLEVKKVKQIVI